MKYVPKEITEEVNVAKTSPLAELFTLMSGILGIIIIVYILTGFAVDLIVATGSSEFEQTLGKIYNNSFIDKKRPAEVKTEAKIQKILDNLTAKRPDTLRSQHYAVHVIPDETINALALPGNNIIVYTGLLKQIDSENELSFILGHELGHFAHKDNLRSMGRGLVLLFISTTLFGENSTVTDFIVNSMKDVNLKFSQQQETDADLYALELVNKEYGHVGGSLDFLKKAAKKEKTGKILYFFTTHPHPIDRIEASKQWIKTHQCLIQKTIPIKF